MTADRRLTGRGAGTVKGPSRRAHKDILKASLVGAVDPGALVTASVEALEAELGGVDLIRVVDHFDCVSLYAARHLAPDEIPRPGVASYEVRRLRDLIRRVYPYVEETKMADDVKAEVEREIMAQVEEERQRQQ